MKVPGGRSARAAGNYSTLVVFFAISMVKYANVHLPVKTNRFCSEVSKIHYDFCIYV